MTCAENREGIKGRYRDSITLFCSVHLQIYDRCRRNLASITSYSRRKELNALESRTRTIIIFRTSVFKGQGQ